MPWRRGFYRGEEVLERECACVFGRSWQLVAHAGELQAAGDHVVSEVGRTPVLVVRGEDEVLRAFPNVCRHRAGPLAWRSGKGARVLRCKYHGWIYGLEGTLREAAHAAPGLGGAAAAHLCAGRLPVHPLRGQAEGTGVPDESACRSGHPRARG